MNNRRKFLMSIRRVSGALAGGMLLRSPAPERVDTVLAPGSPPAWVSPWDDPRDTVIVQDVSGSMGLCDYRPTRLAGGVQAATAHVRTCAQKRPDDRVAIVSFHTSARHVLPLTPVTCEKDILDALAGLSADGGTNLAKGLEAVVEIFENEPVSNRTRHAILQTDGRGGEPLVVAIKLKEKLGVVIDVVGIGGSPSEVNEALLRQVATTEPDGSNHYRFVNDPQTLCEHYRRLATGLIWTGEGR